MPTPQGMEGQDPGADKHDAVRQLADSLRIKSGIPWRTAVMGEQRFEFIRGKDFVRYFVAHEDKMQPFAPKALSQREQIKALGDLFLRRRLMYKGERKFGKKPGRKRPVKWPKTLKPVVDFSFTEEHFYAWRHDRPSSPYIWLLSVLLAIIVIGFCLFPLAPHWAKLAVVYTSAGLIIAIVVLIAVRSVLALVTWGALGRSLWLFPHLLSEEKGLDEAFWPILEMDEPPDKNWKNHWSLRVGTMALVAATLWVVLTYAPETGSAKDNVAAAHDAILEMLNLHDKGRMKLDSAGAPQTPGQGTGPGRPTSFT